MIKSGATPSPCPGFNELTPEYLTILKPSVLLTLTSLAVVPSVLATAAPPAFKHHATVGAPDSLV